MTPNYQKMWETMNELEMVTSKICSAREILDSATDALEEHRYEKAESLITAAHEFLGYYLQEFDDKFKDAWKETIVAQKEKEQDDYMRPWGHSDMEALSHQKDDKVIKWRLPVEEVENGDTGEQEYFITFPDDLLEAANLKQGDEVEWHDQGDGSFILKKSTKTNNKVVDDEELLKDEMESLIDKAEMFYHKASHKVMSYQEAIDAGYELTADGFWAPPEQIKNLYVCDE